MKLKKIKFWIAQRGRIAKEVSGYQVIEPSYPGFDIALHRDEYGMWTVTHLPTGMGAIPKVDKRCTRAATLQVFANTIKDVGGLGAMIEMTKTYPPIQALKLASLLK